MALSLRWLMQLRPVVERRQSMAQRLILIKGAACGVDLSRSIEMKNGFHNKMISPYYMDVKRQNYGTTRRKGEDTTMMRSFRTSSKGVMKITAVCSWGILQTVTVCAVAFQSVFDVVDCYSKENDGDLRFVDQPDDMDQNDKDPHRNHELPYVTAEADDVGSQHRHHDQETKLDEEAGVSNYRIVQNIGETGYLIRVVSIITGTLLSFIIGKIIILLFILFFSVVMKLITCVVVIFSIVKSIIMEIIRICGLIERLMDSTSRVHAVVEPILKPASNTDTLTEELQNWSTNLKNKKKDIIMWIMGHRSYNDDAKDRHLSDDVKIEEILERQENGEERSDAD